MSPAIRTHLTSRLRKVTSARAKAATRVRSKDRVSIPRTSDTDPAATSTTTGRCRRRTPTTRLPRPGIWPEAPGPDWRRTSTPRRLPPRTLRQLSTVVTPRSMPTSTPRAMRTSRSISPVEAQASSRPPTALMSPRMCPVRTALLRVSRQRARSRRGLSRPEARRPSPIRRSWTRPVCRSSPGRVLRMRLPPVLSEPIRRASRDPARRLVPARSPSRAIRRPDSARVSRR